MSKLMKRIVVVAFVLLLPGMVFLTSEAQAQTLQPGIAFFSFVNLDYNNGNSLYVDEFTVYDLDQDTTAFTYDFTGSDGDYWDSGLFSRIWSSGSGGDIKFSIESDTGKMDIGPRREGTGSAYSRVTPIMAKLDNSEVLMRFRVDEVGLNQYLRVWVQSDKFGSGSSFAVNGYGIALHFGRDELTLQNRTDSTTTALDTVTANVTTDWHWLRLRAAHGKVSVKLWNDNDQEPEDWVIDYPL